MHLADQAAKFPRLELAPFEAPSADPRDQALAHAIVDAATRRWLTLRFLIQMRLTQPFEDLEPPMRAAMLGGAAQILLLDRVPAYAAINHAVEWAKRRIRRGAGGMVNAVLRRLAELVTPPGPALHPQAVGGDGRGGQEVDRAAEAATGRAALLRPHWSLARDELPLESGGALAMLHPVLPDDPLERLSIAASVPAQLLESWSRAFGADEARRLAQHSLTHPPTVLRFAGGSPPPGLPLRPEQLTPHERRGFFVYSGPRDTLVALLDTRDDVWAQDPGSSLAVESIADLPAGLIIDVCAGQGTKTRQLAATFPRARIVATDTDERRRKTLAQVFRGHPRVTVTTRDGLYEFIGQADLVLLDVPCSNTGVLARRPEAKYRFGRASIEELNGIQRQIIADAIPLLREKGPGHPKGGVMLYSTCSLEAAENAQHIAWAAQWHRFEASRERLSAPKGGPGRPSIEYADGSYSVVLGRSKV